MNEQRVPGTWFLIAVFRCVLCGHESICVWRDPDLGDDVDYQTDPCSVCGQHMSPVESSCEEIQERLTNAVYTETERSEEE